MAFECQQRTEVSKDLANFGEVSLQNQNESIHLNFITESQNSEPKSCNCFTNPKCEKLEVRKRGLDCSHKRGACCCTGRQSPGNEVKSNGSRSISDLPAALISEILNYLDPKELGVVSCVSTTLHSLASEHHVWKEFYCERWGLPIACSAPLAGGFSYEKSWRELFVEREFRSRTFLGRYSIDDLYGHTEAILTVFVLPSAKLIFTSGYDSILRMWDLEEGKSISSSRPLGCTMRAIAADRKLLVTGGTEGFILCWRALEGLQHLFDLTGSDKESTEFRLWEHEGAITSLALDLTRIYSGSWDMTVRVWDRALLNCLKVLRHGDWIYGVAPHHSMVVSASGSDLYIWDTNSCTLLTVINGVHVGYVFALARSHTGDFLFTGGEDGAIHMFEIVKDSDEDEVDILKLATWTPHSAPVHSLAFEFPWLVSASSDGRLALIDVRKLLRTRRRLARRRSLSEVKNVEPPQRMLHGFECNLLAVHIGADRIVCGGEGGVVRIWNFSQALEVEERARAMRGIRLANRMRRRKHQVEMSSKGGQTDRCSVAAKKNSVNGDRNGVWHRKRGMSGKLNA